MDYNVNIRWMIYIISFFFFAQDINTNTSTQKEGKDIKRERTKNLSLESITCFFTESFVILELIENMDEETQKKLGVLCNGCKKKILSPAELAGWLCGGEQDQNNLEKLNIVLKQKNVQDINNFILSIAQEKKVECAFCEKYIEWVCLQYNELQNQKT